MCRSRVLIAVVVLTMHVGSAGATAATAAHWPAWQRFTDRFVQADGRVVDLTFGGKSTSEGQSYGLFFALVANDRGRFDAILDWTSTQLAEGALGQKLPAWHWGKSADGHWRIQDANAAADADLWLAYTLLEAGRLWRSDAYTQTGRALLQQIRQQEVIHHGAAGSHLLPGPYGFVLDGTQLRINPSYLPGFQLRYFAHVDAGGPWQKIWDSYLQLAPQVFRAGVAPDLFIVDAQGQVSDDNQRAPNGSYDAIRVYLWAGMSPEQSAPLLNLLRPFVALLARHGAPPEQIDPRSGKATRTDYSPDGFAGALLPFLSALGETQALERQRKRVRAAQLRAFVGASTNYYDEALILFGQGWDERRYRFDSLGRVQPAWSDAVVAHH